MSVLVDRNTAILIHGVEQPLARYQCYEMIRAGTKLVGIVDPGRVGGFPVDSGIVQFDDLEGAASTTHVDALMVFDDALNVRGVVTDALDLGIKLIIVMTEYVPVHDAIAMRRAAHATGARIIGPNSSGILTPREGKAGFFSNDICIPGRVGVLSKSGTLSYAVISEMKSVGLGVSTVVTVGGDMVKCSDFKSLLPLFQADPDTDAIVLLGEVGGSDEERAAEYIAAHVSKPLVAYLSGKSLKPGQSVGHAGAIVRNGVGEYAGKIKALRAAGAHIAEEFREIIPLLQGVINAGCSTSQHRAPPAQEK
jgi:succinyl-CoA synthetase alpha subunit